MFESPEKSKEGDTNTSSRGLGEEETESTSYAKDSWIEDITTHESKSYAIIDEYDPFDPQKELEKIKHLPTEEKESAIESYKRNHNWQQFVIANLYDEIAKELAVNPDTPKERLFTKVESAAKDGNLTESHIRNAEQALDAYYKRFNNIKELSKKYEDDEELFAHVTGSEAEGKIDAIIRPTTIIFRCFRKEDYAKIFHLEKQDISDEEVKKAAKSGGVSVSGGPAGLHGAITAEKAHGEIDTKSKQTQMHETEHAIQKMLDWYVYPDNSYFLTIDLSEADTIKKVGKEANKQLHERITLVKYTSMKNEIIAYMKGSQKEDIDAVYEILTKSPEDGGLYWPSLDEQEDIISQLTATLHGDDAFRQRAKTEIHEQMHEVLESFEDTIREALKAYKTLQEFGYSDRKISMMLMAKPLDEWQRVAERMT